MKKFSPLIFLVILSMLACSSTISAGPISVLKSKFKNGIEYDTGVYDYSSMAIETIGVGEEIQIVSSELLSEGAVLYKYNPGVNIDYFNQHYYGDDCSDAEVYLVFRFNSGIPIFNNYRHLLRIGFKDDKLYCANAYAYPLPFSLGL